MSIAQEIETLSEYFLHSAIFDFDASLRGTTG